MPLPDFLRLIKGSMNEDDDGDVDMLLSEPIGFDPNTYNGISARMFGSSLAQVPKRKTVNLLINTLGGNVDEGVAMYNMITARGNVNTVVIGYAASMGAIIAQAGAVRKMMPGTMMIIHNPQGEMKGEEGDMNWQADMLGKLNERLGYAQPA